MISALNESIEEEKEENIDKNDFIIDK